MDDAPTSPSAGAGKKTFKERGTQGKTIVRDGKTYTSINTGRMTKAQTAAIVNEEINNPRENADLMIIGVEPTTFAIDELFGKKDETSMRMTRMTRTTRVTKAADSKLLEEEEEEVEVPV